MSSEATDYPPQKSTCWICALSFELSTDCFPHSLNDLPFVEAIYKELLRWRPVSPIPIPRLLTTDDVFHGTFGAYLGLLIYSHCRLQVI